MKYIASIRTVIVPTLKGFMGFSIGVAGSQLISSGQLTNISILVGGLIGAIIGFVISLRSSFRQLSISDTEVSVQSFLGSTYSIKWKELSVADGSHRTNFFRPQLWRFKDVNGLEIYVPKNKLSLVEERDLDQTINNMSITHGFTMQSNPTFNTDASKRRRAG